MTTWNEMTLAIKQRLTAGGDTTLDTFMGDWPRATTWQTMCRRAQDVPANYSALAPIMLIVPGPMRINPGKRTICDAYLAEYLVVFVFAAPIDENGETSPEYSLLVAQRTCAALRTSLDTMPTHGTAIRVSQLSTTQRPAPIPHITAAILIDAEITIVGD